MLCSCCRSVSLLVILIGTADAAVWQWSVAVQGPTSPETNDLPQAYLWIPPACQRVRGVVVGQHNMEEEPLLEHPAFRQVLEELNLAAVWVTPPFNPLFLVVGGADKQFTTLMARLAEISGYAELKNCPVVPIGHSAIAGYPWNFAAWRPERTLAVISVSGEWPIMNTPQPRTWEPNRIDGVPGLVTVGEYEWARDRSAEGAKQRAEHPRWPLSMLAEPGSGHFDVTDAKAEFLGFYLRKACEYRLTESDAEDGTTNLRPIDAESIGWLVDRWRGDDPPRWPAAPVSEYEGEKHEAFWCFDAEHAQAVEALGARERGKQVQLLGYMQDGQLLPQVKGTHQQVTIPFQSLDGGPRFRLTGAFLDTVPAGRPERWTKKSAGVPIEHGSDAENIKIERICGPVRQLDDSTFEICFHRLGLNNRKRSPEVWLAATHPGDDRFRRSVQQAQLRAPLENPHGIPQMIDFPEMADQTTGEKEIPLAATSSVGLPIDYFVLYGPAEIEGDTLRLTEIPPRAKFPVAVKVVAWQWGRCEQPHVQTAEPVSQVFHVVP